MLRPESPSFSLLLEGGKGQELGINVGRKYKGGRIPWGWDRGEIGKAQYFGIGKAHRGGNHYGRERELGVQGTGNSDPLPSPSPITTGFCFTVIVTLRLEYEYKSKYYTSATLQT